MPNITTKSFNQLISDFAASVQGSASVLIDFTIGSILRAVGEAVSSVVLWLESLILLLLQTTRASTSTGADLDSFVADFGLTRLPAVAATGAVTFARFTSTLATQIPVGALVATADGTQQFAVIADTTQSAYNPGLNAYVVPAGTASINATVRAINAGTQGNVSANTITVIAQAIQYVDTVTNALAFTSGEDAESDAALRSRFITYLASLAKATKTAIINAVQNLQVGATCVITENFDYNGTYDPGSFYVVVDDGSGAPPSGFISSAFNAIDATRACGIRPAAFAPITVTANVVMTAAIAAGYDPVATKALVRSAVQTYIQSLGLGVNLAYSRLAQVAYDASPGVTNITGLTLNGGTSDLTVTAQQRIIAGTVTVN